MALLLTTTTVTNVARLWTQRVSPHRNYKFHGVEWGVYHGAGNIWDTDGGCRYEARLEAQSALEQELTS